MAVLLCRKNDKTLKNDPCEFFSCMLIGGISCMVHNKKMAFDTYKKVAHVILITLLSLLLFKQFHVKVYDRQFLLSQKNKEIVVWKVTF